MRIVYDPVRSLVEFNDEQERAIVQRILCWEDPRKQFNEDFLAGKWDGWHCFMELSSDGTAATVATGLVPFLMRSLPSTVRPRTLRSWRPPAYAPTSPYVLDGYVFDGDRAYQRGAVDVALKRGRGIFHVPPRGGKTALSAAVTRRLDAPSLLIVDAGHLMEQTYEVFCKVGLEDVGRYSGEYKEPNAKHVIAVRNSLFAAVDRRDECLPRLLFYRSLLNVDEAHMYGNAVRSMEVINLCRAHYRFAYSGTPFHKTRTSGFLDGARDPGDYALVGAFGETIVKIPVSFLMRRKLLAPAYFWMIGMPTPQQPPKTKDWTRLETQGIVRNDYRNQIIAALAAGLVLDHGRRVLILVRRKVHGRALVKMLHGHDVRGVTFCFGGKGTTVYDGRSFANGEKQSQVLDAFRSGESRCLVASSVFDQAVDFPAADTLIVGAGLRKNTRVIQRVFRPMTALAGKRDALIFDFFDTGHPVLRRHSECRQEEYLSSGLLEAQHNPNPWMRPLQPAT